MTPTTRPNRYRLTRMPWGWLLLSNDARRMFLLRKYQDGGSYGLVDEHDKPIADYDVWEVRELRRDHRSVFRNDAGEITEIDRDDLYEETWGDDDWWAHVEENFPTRREAIAYAIKLAEDGGR